MALRTFRGKCPRCCPDGGACFKLYDDHRKQCSNCGMILPLRRVKATGKLSRSQQRVIDHILTKFGGEVTKLEFIGRKVWIVIKNSDRGWIRGDTVYGAIGVGGGMDLKMHRFGDDAIMKNRDDVNARLY